MAKSIEILLHNLQLQDHLDISTYADLFSSTCTNNENESIQNIEDILRYSVSWDDKRLRETSQSIYHAWLHPHDIIPNSAVVPEGQSTNDSQRTTSSNHTPNDVIINNEVLVPVQSNIDIPDIINSPIDDSLLSISLSATITSTITSNVTNNESISILSNSKNKKRKGKYTQLLDDIQFTRPPPRPVSPHISDDEDISSSNNNRICRHYLAGSCLRSDCEFSHSTKLTPCKFWLNDNNGCSSGNDCVFLHGVENSIGSIIDIRKLTPEELSTHILEKMNTINSNTNDNNTTNTNNNSDTNNINTNNDDDNEWLDTLRKHNENFWEDEIDENLDNELDISDTTALTLDSETFVNIEDLSQFPQLPNTNTTTITHDISKADSYSSSTIASNNLRNKLLIETLKLVFPYVSLSILQEQLINSSYNLLIAVELIQQNTGVQPNKDVLQRGQHITYVPKVTVSKEDDVAFSLPVYDNISHQKARDIASSIARVSTGTIVSSLYTAAREKAAMYARARNAAFDRATKAYLAGNRLDAKRFSQQGHEIEINMFQAHNVAANLIFESRNMNTNFILSNAKLGLREQDIRIIDLHGLHPTEAITICNELLSKNNNNNFNTTLSNINNKYIWLGFLVGTRHHSQQGSRSLRTAVWEVLYSYNEHYKLYEPIPGIFLCEKK